MCSGEYHEQMVQRCRSQAEWQECLRCPQETGQATPRGSRPGGPCDLNGAKTMGGTKPKYMVNHGLMPRQ